MILHTTINDNFIKFIESRLNNFNYRETNMKWNPMNNYNKSKQATPNIFPSTLFKSAQIPHFKEILIVIVGVVMNISI